MNRGNSGGPAFNLNGEVVGINTAIFSPSGGNVGIAFAIPASTAQDVVKDLMTDGTVNRGWLGVQIQPVDKDIADSLGLTGTKGALVSEAQDDGPGKKAGIKAGDVIIAVDGKTVDWPARARQDHRQHGPRQGVEVTLWRDGKSETVKLDARRAAGDRQAGVGRRAAGARQEQLAQGLRPDRHPSEDGKGLVVTDVDPDGAAAERGIQAGDVIVSVNSKEVSGAGDFEKAIADAPRPAARRCSSRWRATTAAASSRCPSPRADAISTPMLPATHPRGREHRIATEPARLSVSVPVPAAAGPITCCRNSSGRR